MGNEKLGNAHFEEKSIFTLNIALCTYEHHQFPQRDSEKALCLGKDKE